MDERVRDLYISLENGAAFQARVDGAYINLCLSEGTGAADWSATMSLGLRDDARKLRDWLNENVKD